MQYRYSEESQQPSTFFEIRSFVHVVLLSHVLYKRSLFIMKHIDIDNSPGIFKACS
jgi:hypothetical protein